MRMPPAEQPVGSIAVGLAVDTLAYCGQPDWLAFPEFDHLGES